MAIKKLKENTAVYERKGYKVEKGREQNILTLIQDIKYQESIK